MVNLQLDELSLIYLYARVPPIVTAFGISNVEPRAYSVPQPVESEWYGIWYRRLLIFPVFGIAAIPRGTQRNGWAENNTTR
jgi:hypothetical protein